MICYGGKERTKRILQKKIRETFKKKIEEEGIEQIKSQPPTGRQRRMETKQTGKLHD